MEFKNETGNNAKYRLGSINAGFEWFTIRPGETADIPAHIGAELKLTEVKDEPTKKDPINADEDVQEDSKTEVDESNAESEKKIYFEKLVEIKGVGEKSAKDIIQKYPTIEELVKAVQDGEEVHKHDGVDKAVKESF